MLHVIIFWPIITPRACAASGVKWSKKIFEMAWTTHFQDFWAYQRVWKRSCLTYLYLLLADSLPLAAVSAVFSLSGPLCQPFYLRPWVTPTLSQKQTNSVWGIIENIADKQVIPWLLLLNTWKAGSGLACEAKRRIMRKGGRGEERDTTTHFITR